MKRKGRQKREETKGCKSEKKVFNCEHRQTIIYMKDFYRIKTKRNNYYIMR